MKTRILIVLFTITSIISTVAQKNFKPGKIFFKDGTEKSAMIFFKDNFSTPTTIKAKIDGKTKEFSPSEISGFEVDAKAKFLSKKVNYIDDSKVFLRKDSLKTIPSIEEEVFLRVHLLGLVNLYELNKQKELTFYIESGEDAPAQLLELKYKNENNDEVVLEKYKTLLNTKISGCPSLFKQVNTTGLRASDLKKLLNKFHSCANAPISYESKKEGLGIEISLMGGLTSTLHEFNDRNPVRSTRPTGEVQFEFIIPRNDKAWSIFFNPGYWAYSAPPTSFKNDTVELKHFRPRVGLKRAVINKEKLKVFAQTGFTNSFYLNKGLPNEFRLRESGWFVGTTLTYDDFIFNLNYDWSAGYFNVETIDVDLQVINVMVGYRIFKNKYGRD